MHTSPSAPTSRIPAPAMWWWSRGWWPFHRKYSVLIPVLIMICACVQLRFPDGDTATVYCKVCAASASMLSDDRNSLKSGWSSSMQVGARAKAGGSGQVCYQCDRAVGRLRTAVP